MSAARWITLCALLTTLHGCRIVIVDRASYVGRQTAVPELRAHESEYRQIAGEWLRAGHQEFCRFGPDSYRWNEYWVRPTWLGWEVMPWNGLETGKRPASSFDEAAVLAGVAPATVRYWMQKVSGLSVDCISRNEVIL